jgi:hypothetical protein
VKVYGPQLFEIAFRLTNGGAVAVILTFLVVNPQVLDDLNVTLYVPAVVKVICGLADVEPVEFVKLQPVAGLTVHKYA